MTMGPPPERLHGTEARARRHYRQGEKPCEACRLAYNQAQALRKGCRVILIRCREAKCDHSVSAGTLKAVILLAERSGYTWTPDGAMVCSEHGAAA